MGIVKPKTLDHDSYVTPGSKRRWSTDAAGDAPQQKHARVETVTVAEDGDSGGLDIEEANKKSVSELLEFLKHLFLYMEISLLVLM